MGAWVYILRGSTGRHYYGSTVAIDERLAQHQRGQTHTTRRLGEKLELVVSREYPTLAEARQVERWLKRMKNPRLAIDQLRDNKCQTGWCHPETIRGRR